MKAYIYIIMFAAGMAIAGCTDALETYSGTSGVYFAMGAGKTYANADTTYVESSNLPFIVTGSRDSVFNVKIKIVGAVSQHDRNVEARIVEDMSTVTAEDYEPLQGSYVLKAGEVFGNIPIRFLRPSSLEGKQRTMTIELVENSDFSLPIRFWRNSSTEYVNVTRHSIIVSDKYVQLPGYSESHFGAFSEKKMKILLDLFGMKLTDFNASLPLTMTKAMGQKFDRWLQEQKSKGETVYEEDGSEMKSGEYIY
ncbi:MAG: DUF4843 domain-containing protein [Bacteroidales bacterium]|nr:DUF4843 domain-containing protein [Bacteroides sp.]MCM1199288.1 DUF4843 domain-containing protein [Clostridium sp.]MCM1501370.1 DUF4843 domain-containing protein [Bacteroidales bacterium]